MAFRTPQRLKSSLVVIGVLLLLLAGIGFQSLALRDETQPRTAMPRPDEKVTRSARVREPVESSRGTAEHSSSDPDPATENLQDPPQENNQAAHIWQRGGGATTARLPSQIYYVRSHTLLTGRVKGQSRASAIEMLEQAVAHVTSTLPEGILVFDAEGLARSHGRLVVYAKPGYDLTDEVAAVFDELQMQQQNLSEGGQAGK